MDTQSMIGMLLMLALSLVCLIISLRSFSEKGIILNNAWIYATKEEREKLDRHAYYRQTAVSFLLLTGAFASAGIHIMTNAEIWKYIAIGFAAAVIVYAAASTVRIEKAKKENRT